MLKHKLFRVVFIMSAIAPFCIPEITLADSDVDMHHSRTRSIASLWRHYVAISAEDDCLSGDCCTTDCDDGATPDPTPDPTPGLRPEVVTSFQTQNVVISKGTPRTVTVTCPVDKIVVGGGASVAPASATPVHAAITTSMPVCIMGRVIDANCMSGANGWLAKVANYEPENAFVEVTVTALCMQHD